MDRPIESGIRRRRLLRRVLTAVAVIALGAMALVWARERLRPSVRRSEIRTGRVDRGPMEATITASGTVVPEYEHVLTSPIDSRVGRILLLPGAIVEPGQPIVGLDAGEARLEVERLDDRIALQENERAEARLEHSRAIEDQRTRRDIKALELRSLEHEAARNRRLLAEGLLSQDQLRKTETDLERARIELRQVDASLGSLEAVLARKLQGIDLEIGILRTERAEAARRLDLSTAASDRRGVLTWVVPSEGIAVRKGDELARIADLSSFRVVATVADVHGTRVGEGLPVRIHSGDNRLAGRIERVHPTVENGLITFEVELFEKAHPLLRHNLRVDVYVVTERVEDALRLKRGPFGTVDGVPAVFVLRGGRAVRTPVRFGITNMDHYQVVEGLAEGDEVIVSDMSDRMHVKEVRLR